MNIECVVGAGALLGESPVWSEAEQCLYWVDINGKAVHRFNPATGDDAARGTPGRPGSLALTSEQGRLLLAMEHEIGWFDWGTATFTPWLVLEPAGTGNRQNDGRTDPAGRFWVGSMYENTRAGKSTGMLHLVEPAGTATTVRNELGVSNGLAFSPDGTVAYHADTSVSTVWAYDYDTGTGARSNERVFTDFAGLPGKPDGACVDAEGCYWIACVRGWAVARLTPAGETERIIELPVEMPTMPAFGGPDLETLYLTSIAAPDDPAQPLSGGLFALDVGVQGRPEPRFGS